MNRLLTCSVLALLWLASPALAHETIPADWCPAGTRPVVVGSFQVTPAELVEYRQANQGTASSASCGTRTCGIIDDWFWGQERASLACGELGLRMHPPEDAVAFVQSPADFLSSTHHEDYQFEDGVLSGQCVVCRVRRVVPALPIRRDD